MKADLHIHTTASDGRLSPREVVETARQLGLALIAITDHDTVAGSKEAISLGQQLGIRIMSGVEISTDLEGEEVHILGYNLCPDDGQLNQVLLRLRGARMERARALLTRLQQLGYSLTWEDVIAQSGEADSIGRPHFARAMVVRGYAGSVREVFDRLLSKNRPAWVERYKLTPAEAIETIHRAGGLAFLAHPGIYKQGHALALQLLDLGLNGLEVYHPEHSSLQVTEYLQLARSKGICISGGSDCHGPGKGQSAMIGTVTVNLGVLEDWPTNGIMDWSIHMKS